MSALQDKNQDDQADPCFFFPPYFPVKGTPSIRLIGPWIDEALAL